MNRNGTNKHKQEWMTKRKNKYKKDWYSHIQGEIEYTDNNPFDTLENEEEDSHAEKGKQLENNFEREH